MPTTTTTTVTTGTTGTTGPTADARRGDVSTVTTTATAAAPSASTLATFPAVPVAAASAAATAPGAITDLTTICDEAVSAILRKLPPKIFDIGADIDDLAACRAAIHRLFGARPAAEMPDGVDISTVAVAGHLPGDPQLKVKVYRPRGLAPGAGCLYGNFDIIKRFGTISRAFLGSTRHPPAVRAPWSPHWPC